MKIKTKKLILPTMITAILSGCGPTEEAYDTLPRSDEQISKSQIKTDQVYLYMPSMGHAPKYAVSMSPFTQGQEKLVTLRFDADTDQSASGQLEIRELNTDVITQEQLDSGDFGRWLGNQDATAPIISLPGEFVDYQCAEDNYGDCTNNEETVDPKEVSWENRQYFQPSFENVNIKERTWDDLFTFANGCLSKSGSPRLVENTATGWKGYEISEDGSINFELEQDYVVANNWNCMINALNRADSISDLSFTASRFYSLVPLDLIRSKDYTPIVYRQGDEDTYGFFTNGHTTTDPSYISGDYEQAFEYMHRFNPDLDELVYYLSDSFNENEETQFFKKITIDAVAKINLQLAEAGVPQIMLKDAEGKQSGDLRYNVINLIDEPLSNGLAGYGPSAANPLTGEIVHGHVNQYSGVLRSISDWLWDSIVIDYNADRIEYVEKETTTTGTASEETTIVSESESASPSSSQAKRVEEEILASPTEEETLEQVLAAYTELENEGSEDDDLYKLSVLKELEANLWSDNNMFPISEMRLGASIKELPTSVGGRSFDFQNPELWVDGEVGDVGKLKKWADLSDEVKGELGIYLAGVYYGKTIVHELGHNLGLRHNFKGSNDEDNYFSKAKAAEYELDAVPAYTSIMDYNPSMLNALPVFGPYDIAALHFGYKREVEAVVTTIDAETAKEVATPGFIDISDYDEAIYNVTFNSASLSDEEILKEEAAYNGVVEAIGISNEIKEYKFCTDGNVSLNADCNRHDEGRNVEEITDYKLERYDDLYFTRIIRGERANFSESTISSYAVARIFEFQGWRDAIHNYDRYSEFLSDDYGFDVTLGDRMYWANNWTTCNGDYGPTEFTYEYYCSSAKAIENVRSKLIDVMLEPDHTCEVSITVNDETSIEYIKLADIIDDYSTRNNYEVNHVPESCFDEAVVASIETYIADIDEDFIDGSVVNITAETGKYLNSGSAPRPAPVNNYSNYIDYLGYWGDKLAAASVFVDRVGMRSSTSRSDHALSDYNGIEGTSYTDPTTDFLDQLILGTDQNVTFTDESGKTVTPLGEFSGISWDDMIERMPYYGSATVRRYFDIPKYEKIPLIEGILGAMIKQAERNSDEQDYEDFLERISLREDDPASSNVRTYTRIDDEVYYATEGNEYAWEMIPFIEDIDRLNAIAETIYEAEEVIADAEDAGVDATDAENALINVKAAALVSYAALVQSNDYYTQFYESYARGATIDNVALINEWYDYRTNSLEHLPITE